MANFRTTDAKVREVLNEDNTSILMTPFIEVANNLVTNYIVTACGASYDATTLELIERWLSAFFYTVSDRRLASEITGRAEGVYQGKTDLGFDANEFGQMAKRIDTDGCLAKLDANPGKRVVGARWEGTKPTDRVPEFWR